jgi:hypothetical protein
VRFAGCAFLAALCWTPAPPALPAQGPRVTAWEVGVASLGEDAQLLQMGYRASWVEPRSVGVEVSVAASPIALMALLIHGAVDLDAAYVVPLDPGVALVGRAGGTALFWAGQWSAGSALGYNAGLGLVGRGPGKGGVRLDVVRRWFPTEQGTRSVTSFTIGVAVFRMGRTGTDGGGRSRTGTDGGGRGG